MPMSIKKNGMVFDESGAGYIIGDLIYTLPYDEKIYALKDCRGKVYIEAPDIGTNRYAVKRMSNVLTDKADFKRLFWPEKVVKEENSPGFTGFISTAPEISGSLVSLTDIVEERQKKSTFTPYEKKYYLNLGIQLAEITETVHKYGYIIGNLSPDMFSVSGDGTLYSCFSYRFSFEKIDPFEKHLYVAPEWLNKINKESIVFDFDSDAFLYAIVLFRLLTGMYPFLPESDISRVEREVLWERMLDGKSVYFYGRPDMIKSIDSALLDLPSGIGDLFRRTFDYCGCETYCEQRPSIEEWLTVLKKS